MNIKNNENFPGFPAEPVTTYWPYPKALNGWWHTLTGVEQKCLDYILRHTWGFKKIADSISISQFIHGITKRDGTAFDRGTGIKNEKTVRKALKNLVKKGFIERQDRSNIGREPIYKLRIANVENMEPLPNNGTPPSPKNGDTPYHELVSTINDISIKDNNNITDKSVPKINHKNEIAELIAYLSSYLDHKKFPNYGKQAKYTKLMLEANYSVDDIKWAIDKMFEDDWWSKNSFDMKNVADEIPKLMNRTYKL